MFSRTALLPHYELSTISPPSPLKPTRHSLLLSTSCLLVGTAVTSLADPPKPNILFILADDMGYGDVGVLWQNARPADQPHFQTPNLDALANDGIILRNHTAASPVCSPSRASLLTGRHQGQCGVRGNVTGGAALPAGHTLGSLLRSAGYATHAIGKWGVSSADGVNGHPLDRGFDSFYGFANQSAAHEHYPGNNGEIFDGRARVTSNLTGLYSTDLFTARAKKVIIDHHTSSPAQPLFLYLNLTAPHAKLQVGPGAYPAGGGLTGGLQWPLAQTGIKDTYLHPETDVSWPASARRYASMVRRMDEAVADLRQLLADLGMAQDTLIIFTSDNGTHNEAGSGGTIANDAEFFKSAGPFDDVKRGLLEGGVRVPALVTWPAGIPAGRASDHANTSVDWLPTLCELAGVPAPGHTDGISLVPLLRGQSGQGEHTRIYHEFQDDATTTAIIDAVLTRKGYTTGQNRGFQQSVRSGSFKALRYQTSAQTTPVRLHEVSLDPYESTNRAGDNGVLAAALRNEMIRMRAPHPTWPSVLDGVNAPALTDVTAGSPGLTATIHEGATPWVAAPGALSAGNTTSSSGFAPDLHGGTTAATVVFRGLIEVPAAGQWTFAVRSDSGAVLRIHDAIVVEDDFARTGAMVEGTKRLAAGLHPVTLIHRRPQGVAPVLEVEWQGPGTAREAVPTTRLFLQGPPPSVQAVDDSASTSKGRSVLVDVLANDLPTGGEAAGLSISSVHAITGGSAAIEAGKVRFTPDSTYLGEARIDYQVTNGSNSDTGALRVGITFRDDVVWMPLNEGAGATTVESGGELSGTLEGFSGGGWVTPGRFGSALQFNGSSRRVVLGGYKGVTGTTARTTSAWIRTTAHGPILAWGGPSTNGSRWIFRVQETNPPFITGAVRVEVSGGYIVGTKPVNDGQWHHIAAVLPSGANNVSSVRLYVDGVRETISAVQAQTMNTSNAQDVWIGADMQSRWFNGDMDEVRIERVERSDAALAALAANGTTLAALWHRRHFADEDLNWNASDAPDGQPRLIKYFAGSDPRQSSSLAAWEIGTDGALIALRRALPAVGDATWTIESSNDLVTWDPLTAQILSVTPQSDHEIVTAEVPALDPDATKAFYRLRISLQN